MNRRTPFLFALPLSLILSGCWEDEPNHTVQYFVDNPEARTKTLKQCEVLDDALSEANCLNASAASQAVRREENRESRKSSVKALYGDGS